MNNVIDEVLAGSPKYTLTYNDNTTATGVSIDLETAVTTAGTPLNKALFDSIQADLNTRLLIADKTSTAEAQAGTNDTHYTTPAKVKTQLQYLTKTGTGSNTTTTAQTTTIYSSSDVPSGAKRVVVSGYIYNRDSNNMSFLYINGTSLNSDKMNSTNTYPSLSTTQVGVRCGRNQSTSSFKIDIDLNTKVFTLQTHFAPNVTGQATTQTDVVVGSYSTLTSVTASLRGNGSSASTTSYTVTYIY